MRLYHFLNEEYCIESIKYKHLKISNFTELNDPFEFFGLNLSDPDLRRAFISTREEISKTKGLVCFSRQWHNPLLWSHYADKHKGICLGFDVEKYQVIPVKYKKNRPKLDPKKINIDVMLELLSTKFSDWSYEDEVRCFTKLTTFCEQKKQYFLDYSSSLILKEVIVGCESNVSRLDINNAMGKDFVGIKPFKVRPAYNTFKITKNLDEKLWK